MKRSVSQKWGDGYSLLEALIVLALIGAITAVSIPYIIRTLYDYRVQTAVAQMRVQFRFARNACVSQKVTYRVVIRNELGSPPNSYEVQKDNGGIWETVQGTDFTLPPGLLIKNTSTAGPFVFTSRGACSPSGQIDLAGTTGQRFQLIIRATGTVDSRKL